MRAAREAGAAGVGLHDPEPEAVFEVVAAIPLDPARRAAGAAGLEAVDVGQICRVHLAKAEPGRGSGQHPGTISASASVRRAFAEVARLEPGLAAQLAVYRHGQPVVDL